ncbi:MAG: glycosyltransferase family 2 protein [Solobacterium sp.]|nr:glycosyltransferase family 2 protein [Solobacterium sp.]
MKNHSEKTELTILMPCLNEAENIASCISDAMAYLRSRNLAGEILIVDNNSTDHSADIASGAGARVISEPRQGYGRALRTGLDQAKGEVIIFGDCDSTYDFRHLDPLYLPLAENRTDFISGNRFAGEMEQGAMSWSHQLGVPFLSLLGRIKFKVPLQDWHCGIRGIRKDALSKLTLKTDGMEFATELVAEAARKGLRIQEVSVPLKKAQNQRKEKLRTIRDGFRHLWFILKS